MLPTSTGRCTQHDNAPTCLQIVTEPATLCLQCLQICFEILHTCERNRQLALFGRLLTLHLGNLLGCPVCSAHAWHSIDYDKLHDQLKPEIHLVDQTGIHAEFFALSFWQV